MDADRYWIAFGIQDPQKFPSRTMNITCEINPPKQGVDHRCAGILLRDSKGERYLGHSGKIGGGKKGVGKQAFLRTYRGKTQQIEWGKDGQRAKSDVIVFGKIKERSFLSNLAKFIVDVDNFKQSVARPLPSAQTLTEKEIKKAESEKAFDFHGLKDAREKVVATIVRRRGQPQFRKKLLEVYTLGVFCCFIGSAGIQRGSRDFVAPQE